MINDNDVKIKSFIQNLTSAKLPKYITVTIMAFDLHTLATSHYSLKDLSFRQIF